MAHGFYRERNETGTALVVSLIMLVVLTMLAVQGMRSNVMQERMAGNFRERNLAFQAAEAALRLGESDTTAFASNKAALVNPVDWNDPAGWDEGDGADGEWGGFDGALAENPHYHVGPPQYVRVGVSLPPVWRYLHPVTAIGFGGQAESVVVIQSSFEPVN